MADNSSNPGRPDRRRIDLAQENECRYWSERFGVSVERLRNAVKEVGASVEAVKEYFGK